jgi:hypothetical protein
MAQPPESRPWPPEPTAPQASSVPTGTGGVNARKENERGVGATHNRGAAQIRMSRRCTYRRHLLLMLWTRRANSVQILFCRLSDSSTLCAKRTVSHDNRFFSPVGEDLCVSSGRPSIRRRCPRRITHRRQSEDTGHFGRCHRRGLVSRSGNRRSEAHQRALTGAGFCVGRECRAEGPCASGAENRPPEPPGEPFQRDAS